MLYYRLVSQADRQRTLKQADRECGVPILKMIDPIYGALHYEVGELITPDELSFEGYFVGSEEDSSYELHLQDGGLARRGRYLTGSQKSNYDPLDHLVTLYPRYGAGICTCGKQDQIAPSYERICSHIVTAVAHFEEHYPPVYLPEMFFCYFYEMLAAESGCTITVAPGEEPNADGSVRHWIFSNPAQELPEMIISESLLGGKKLKSYRVI